MVDLGPTQPDDPRAVAAREKRTVEHTYLYRQDQRSFAEAVFRRDIRTPAYVVRVTENCRGVRFARTERYDPERGSASRTGHGSPQRVDIPRLPKKIAAPMALFVLAVIPILFLALPFPLNIIVMIYWSWSLAWRMAYAVERKRFANHLRKLEPPPPLLSDAEFEARVFALANPDEDHTFDEPAPIPMAKALRDPAWKQWRERYSVEAVREVGKRYMDNPQAFDGVRLSMELRGQALRAQSGRDKLLRLAERVGAATVKTEIATADAMLDHVALMLGCAIRGIEHPSMLTDAPPQLERTFTVKTDCADGHVGEHPILATFTDRQGRQRVTRACKWCPSEWSELV